MKDNNDKVVSGCVQCTEDRTSQWPCGSSPILQSELLVIVYNGLLLLNGKQTTWRRPNTLTIVDRPTVRPSVRPAHWIARSYTPFIYDTTSTSVGISQQVSFSVLIFTKTAQFVHIQRSKYTNTSHCLRTELYTRPCWVHCKQCRWNYS